MLKKIEAKIRYTKKHKRLLNRLKPFQGGEWDNSQLKTKLAPIKYLIRKQLDMIQQGHCAYCGLSYIETSGGEIEHIAPKGGQVRPHHPQFMFTPYNLVLSCHLCNSPQKKGTKNTIVKLDTNYKNCVFNIVHPYFDFPEDHFEWIPEGRKILIQHKSIQGKNSIDMFDLASEAHNTARAKEALFDVKIIEEDEKSMEESLRSALLYRGK